jgi:hypothetical protein
LKEIGVDTKHMPKVSWQLDSFGVSKGLARLAKDMGYDAMFYSRVDAQQKKELINSKKHV